MKFFHALFVYYTKLYISKNPFPKLTLLQITRLIIIQIIIQPWGLIIIPLSAIPTITFGFVYTFFQNVSVLWDSDNLSVSNVIKRSLRQAMVLPRQYNIMLLILIIFGMFVYLIVVWNKMISELNYD